MTVMSNAETSSGTETVGPEDLSGSSKMDEEDEDFDEDDGVFLSWGVFPLLSVPLWI